MSTKSRRRGALVTPHSDQVRAAPAPSTTLYRIGRASALKPGHSMKFLLPIRGADEECFVINFHGHFYAYVNQCRHVPMAMDWVDNQFFIEHGRYLMCQTHNACYLPDTGECVTGPASTCGKLLYRVEVIVEDGVIYARAPDYDLDGDT